MRRRERSQHADDASLSLAAQQARERGRPSANQTGDKPPSKLTSPFRRAARRCSSSDIDELTLLGIETVRAALESQHERRRARAPTPAAKEPRQRQREEKKRRTDLRWRSFRPRSNGGPAGAEAAEGLRTAAAAGSAAVEDRHDRTGAGTSECCQRGGRSSSWRWR